MTLPALDLIAFDADDTLWHNERNYAEGYRQFAQLLAHYHAPEWVRARLEETEARNLQHFGYGIKSFALSMIETALELTEGRISGADIRALLEIAKKMLAAEIELFPAVSQIIQQLSARCRLMIITKGDLLDQETKISRSGLADYFQHVEIVSQKTPESYGKILKKYSVEPRRFMMIGNALRSDILPVLALGGNAVYIPCELSWEHESAEQPGLEQPGFYHLQSIAELPQLLERIQHGVNKSCSQ